MLQSRASPDLLVLLAHHLQRSFQSQIAVMIELNRWPELFARRGPGRIGAGLLHQQNDIATAHSVLFIDEREQELEGLSAVMDDEVANTMRLQRGREKAGRIVGEHAEDCVEFVRPASVPLVQRSQLLLQGCVVLVRHRRSRLRRQAASRARERWSSSRGARGDGSRGSNAGSS